MLDEADQLLALGRTAEAVAMVERASAVGQTDAIFRLALWRLIGQPVPRDLPAARAGLRAAATAGVVEAEFMEIALAANGSGAPSDWSAALARLRTLAACSPAAAQQLAILDAMALDEKGAPRTGWSGEKLSAAPDATLFRRLVAPAECEQIALAAEPLMAPSVVVNPRTGRQEHNPIRTSSGAVLGPTRENLVIQAVARRLAAITDTSWTQGEPFSVLHYAPGQEYRPHLDVLPGAANQRIKTAIIYLNEGYEGGETDFPALGLTVRGGKGDVLVFENVTSDGAVQALARHAGLPVRRGVKWIATRWIRARPYDPWNYREGT